MTSATNSDQKDPTDGQNHNGNDSQKCSIYGNEDESYIDEHDPEAPVSGEDVWRDKKAMGSC